MIRAYGQVMTEARYQEVQEEIEATMPLSIPQKLNCFFFGEKEITLSDWLWFYGSIIFSTTIAVIVCLFLYVLN